MQPRRLVVDWKALSDRRDKLPNDLPAELFVSGVGANVRWLAEWPALAKVEKLSLGGSLYDDSADYIARSAYVKTLRRLSLNGNEAARVLVALEAQPLA